MVLLALRLFYGDDEFFDLFYLVPAYAALAFALGVGARVYELDVFFDLADQDQPCQQPWVAQHGLELY